jgi:CHAT domain-containing protein
VGELDPAYVTAVLEPACREHLAWFYRALLAPLTEALARYRSLIIVPHDALHYLPFHALYDGERYLIEAHQVQYLPAAGLLARARPFGFPNPKPEGSVLILAHTADGRLPAVLDEARAVAASLPAACLLTEDEASLARLVEHAADCRLLHLAAHGVFRGDNPLFSYLQLADGPLRLLDVYGLRLAADLVTLSACETGAGRARGGDLTGLCRGFFAAGARTLVVSLWRVDDAATAELMVVFYRELAAGRSPAAALRVAQLEGLARYGHPYYWAPWVVVGSM